MECTLIVCNILSGLFFNLIGHCAVVSGVAACGTGGGGGGGMAGPT